MLESRNDNMLETEVETPHSIHKINLDSIQNGASCDQGISLSSIRRWGDISIENDSDVEEIEGDSRNAEHHKDPAEDGREEVYDPSADEALLLKSHPSIKQYLDGIMSQLRFIWVLILGLAKIIR